MTERLSLGVQDCVQAAEISLAAQLSDTKGAVAYVRSAQPDQPLYNSHEEICSTGHFGGVRNLKLRECSITQDALPKLSPVRAPEDPSREILAGCGWLQPLSHRTMNEHRVNQVLHPSSGMGAPYGQSSQSLVIILREKARKSALER